MVAGDCMCPLIFCLYLSVCVRVYPYVNVHFSSFGMYVHVVYSHIEGHSIMFGTCLNYISLRLMGVDKDDPQCKKARQWIQDKGGAVGSPQWGKLYMCALNIMEWEGMDPIPPELWILPSWIPYLHPSKWWCHCRLVYLAMGYIFGKKMRVKLNPLLLSLREELYCEPYDKVNWDKYRNYICPLDIYKPLHPLYKFLAWGLSWYEKFVHLPPFSWIRNRSLAKCIDHIKHEDRTTNFVCLGPVNKVLNMICVFFDEGKSQHFEKHVDRCYDYLWKSNIGMVFQGYNGSQLWDTAFTAKAIITSGLADEVQETIRKSHEFIRLSQVREDVEEFEKYYRHISKGGWPFSTRDHGWPITDCTADGLNICLLMKQCSFINSEDHLPEQNAYDAVNVILSMWNKGTGGWATYERSRTSSIIEMLNPAALYGDIMIDYTHVECTSSCLQALVAFREHYPSHRRKEIDRVISRSAQFLRRSQKKEGGWYGAWAICFCYATWFAVGGLIAAGEDKKSPVILRACQFLVERQKEDGGWGESYLSCVKREYVQAKRSQIINTSWALLTLMAADYEDKSVIHRGIELLRRRQMPNGDFPQEVRCSLFLSHLLCVSPYLC